MSSALCVNLVLKTSGRSAKPAPRFRAQLLSREQRTGWERLTFCCSMRIHELSYVGMGCFTWLFYDLAWWVGYSSVFSFYVKRTQFLFVVVEATLCRSARWQVRLGTVQSCFFRWNQCWDLCWDGKHQGETPSIFFFDGKQCSVL